jgi:two-component sensor histidine kinase
VESETGEDIMTATEITMTAADAAPPDAPAMDPTSAVRRILVIEDEEAHAAIIERSFSGDRRYDVTIATTIGEGASAMQHSVFDLVISDWRLPDGEAFDLLSETRRFPLLIMTSYGDEEIAVRAMKAGALDYVVKSERTLLDMARLADGAMRLWGQITAREMAEAQLRRALEEKTILLKEVHHRVKNNLQVVCTLLSMQIDRLAGIEAGAQPLTEAYSRVVAMSLIHQQIYQSRTLADLDFSEYIEQFATRLFEAYCVDPERIRLELDTQSIQLTVDAAVPFGLILNELLSNALKHAFGDRAQGVIRVRLGTAEDGRVELAVSDDGAGLPANFQIEKCSSLGLQVVKTLSHQLRAELTISNEGGAVFRVRWKQQEPAQQA